MHFLVTLFVLVLGRWWRGDQGGIGNGPFAHHQPLGSQMRIDRLEDLAGQVMRFQQVTEPAQRGRIGRNAPVRLNADEVPNRLTVVDRIWTKSRIA